MKRSVIVLMGVLLGFASVSQAAPVLLTDAIRCGAGNATGNIVVGDVTGNNGGATECWGLLGNIEPGPSGDGYQIGSAIYNFLAKQETPGALTDGGLGLVVDPTTGANDGTWKFNNPAALMGANFLIVLKQSTSHAVWLFAGGDNDSFMGDWHVAWSDGISHLTVYKGDVPGDVSVSGTLSLIVLGLVGLRLRRRRHLS